MDKKDEISKAQFEILDIIWEYGPSTVSQIHQHIIQNRNEGITRNTVQVQVKRLLAKDLLKRKSVDGNYYYNATKHKDESCNEIARDVTDRVFNGSAGSLIKCLFNNNGLSKEDIEELEEIIKQSKADER